MNRKDSNLLTKLADAFRVDGWVNQWSGIGTIRDRSTRTEFQAGRVLSDEELDALYGDNDMAARICDALPEDALRLGFGIKVATDEGADVSAAADRSAALLARYDEIGLAQKVLDAWVWGRVFGWGALVLGIDDGQDLAKPLNEQRVRAFTHANVVDKQFVTPLTWYKDPTAPNNGRPATYLLSPHAVQSGPTSALSSEGLSRRAERMRGIAGTVEIHESRLLVFEGARTSIRRRQRRNGYADSVLQRVNTELAKFGVSWDSLAHILQDAYQGVYKMHGLIDLLAANEVGTVRGRYAAMDESRSNFRSMVIDAEQEDFQRLGVQWSGLDKIMELFMIRLSAAARMPATGLLGQSPAGMNATGESDLTLWYDRVAAEREQTLEPRVRRLVRLIAAADGGPTEFEISWPPLWSPSDTESADIRLKQAQADKIYEEMGAATASEIATSRFTADGWSPETAIDLDARRELIDDEIEALSEPPPAPQPAVPVAPGAPPADPAPDA